jgi:hypothetical protein
MSSADQSPTTSPLTRREALQRAAAVLGVVCFPSLFQGVLRGQAIPSSVGAFSDAQRALVAALADRILPRTDTPGALDVGVPAFIDTLTAGYLTDDEMRGLHDALAYFEAAAQAAHGRGFAGLTGAQQDALLRTTAESNEDRPHFLRLREITIVGYFTSETVGKEVLHYDPIPGAFQGCLPLAEVGNRSWTHSR